MKLIFLDFKGIAVSFVGWGEFSGMRVLITYCNPFYKIL